jgi:hypothetical protein
MWLCYYYIVRRSGDSEGQSHSGENGLRDGHLNTRWRPWYHVDTSGTILSALIFLFEIIFLNLLLKKNFDFCFGLQEESRKRLSFFLSHYFGQYTCIITLMWYNRVYVTERRCENVTIADSEQLSEFNREVYQAQQGTSRQSTDIFQSDGSGAHLHGKATPAQACKYQSQKTSTFWEKTVWDHV